LQADKAAVDQTNSQMDTYNADGDVADYNSLVPQQNQEVNTYDSELSQCQTLQGQANTAVDTYNNYISKNE
jgi:hypothetical protein